MKNYDAYIMVHSEEKNNDIGMLEGTDIIKVKEAVDKISAVYNVKADLWGTKNTDDGYERDMRGLRKLINSSLCSIIIVPSGNINKLMPPIIHTISKNKKLYVLVVDEKSKNVLTEITADGYESMTVNGRTSDSDYFKLFSSFIASAKKEMRQLCIQGA